MTWISSVGLAKTNESRPIREAMAQSLDVGGVSLAVITATGVAIVSAPGDSARGNR
jgi:hypothetical protein